VLQIRKINHKETLKWEELISQFQLTGIFQVLMLMAKLNYQIPDSNHLKTPRADFSVEAYDLQQAME